MQILCGQCGKTVKIEDEQVGSSFACPHCDHEIAVPRFDEFEEEDIDALADSAYDVDAEDEGFANQAKEAMNRKVQVVCGSCGRGLSVSARLAGRNARCPACGVNIRIPFPDEEEDEIELEKQTATETEQTEKLDLSGPEAEFALAQMAEASVAVRRPAPVPIRRDRTSYWFAVAVVAVGSLLGGQWVGSVLFPSEPSEEPAGGGDAVAQTPATPTTPTPGGPKSIVPVPPPPTRPAPKTPTPKTTKPVVAVVSEYIDEFAANGYLPAAPNRVYWHVRTKVQAGSDPLSLKTYGRDVVLTVADQAVTSAGLLPGPRDAPMKGKKTTLSVPPQTSREVSFVFEVPAGATAGTLKVGPSKPVAVTPKSLPKPTDPAAVGGTYKERPPRNLRPMLRDPVMRAIQQTASQTLLIRHEGDALAVAIPEAHVSGTGKRLAGALYELKLQYGENSLACKLRAANGGKRVILYLLDEPFHQLTYVKEGETLPVAPRPAPESKPAPDPTMPKPVKPRPATPAPEPKPRPWKSKLPRDHGKPTIFDFD